MRNPFSLLLVVTTLALGAMMTGCGGGGGQTAVQLFLSDAPVNADEMIISITEIDVHKAGGGWITLKTFPTGDPLQVDLLKYRYDGSTSSTFPLLAVTPLDAGHYTMVRLMISSASVVVDGVEHSVDITNVAQTGVKFNREFTVAEGQTVALLLDFNAGKSVIESGNGQYHLQPVTMMVPVPEASRIEGTIVFKDGSDNTVPVPTGATVDAYEISDLTQILNSAPVATDGTFAIAPLFQGTYDLRLSAPSTPYDGKLVAGDVVVVTSETKNIGTVILTP